jgi:hypothetical protein
MVVDLLLSFRRVIFLGDGLASDTTLEPWCLDFTEDWDITQRADFDITLHERSVHFFLFLTFALTYCLLTFIGVQILGSCAVNDDGNHVAIHWQSIVSHSIWHNLSNYDYFGMLRSPRGEVRFDGIRDTSETSLNVKRILRPSWIVPWSSHITTALFDKFAKSAKANGPLTPPL